MKLTITLFAITFVNTQAKKVVEFEGVCNYDNLLDATGVSEAKFIKLLTRGGTDEDKAREVVDEACEEARAAYSDPRKGAFLFGKITDQGWQFDNNFFDGGTFHNEEYEPVAIDEIFEEVFEDIAQDTLITFPDDDQSVGKNFGDCAIPAVMCCWSQDRQANDNNGGCEDDDCVDKDPADNTDICYVDMESSASSSHVAGGFSIYPGETEGDAHCHGFAWNDDDHTGTDYRYRGNNLFYISMYDHLSERGYVREIPGAPMCACLEKMPVVSRSDCTEMAITETYQFKLRRNGKITATIIDTDIEYNACRDANGNDNGNDLEDYLKLIGVDESVWRPRLVGSNDNNEPSNCGDAIQNFFESRFADA